MPPDMQEALDERGMIWRAQPERRPATADELAELRTLDAAAQIQRIVELVDADVTASSIADALGIQRPTLSWRIKGYRQNPATAGTRARTMR